MAAYVVVVRDENEWEIISRVLGELRQGGIIIPPEKVEHLDENFPGWEDHLDTFIDYDFGGEPDIAIDIARAGNHACSVIDDQLIEAQHSLSDND